MLSQITLTFLLDNQRKMKDSYCHDISNCQAYLEQRPVVKYGVTVELSGPVWKSNNVLVLNDELMFCDGGNGEQNREYKYGDEIDDRHIMGT